MITALAVAIGLALSPTHFPEGAPCLDLPPGYFVPQDDWLKLDTEVRRLQGEEVRLRAENESLRRAVNDGPDLKLLGGALLVGVVAGVGLVLLVK